MPRGFPNRSAQVPGAPPDWAGTLGELGLSSRQTEIVRLILDARGDKQIAAELKISVKTVRTYIDCIFRNFGVSGRTELIMRLVSERDVFLERHRSVKGRPRKDPASGPQEGNIARTKS